MLVMQQKLGEVIKIGDDIKIIVMRIERHKVRLGIDAPKNLLITRENEAPIPEANTEPDPPGERR